MNEDETVELEHLIELFGEVPAVNAAQSHKLPEFIASEQGHGLDYLNISFNRRAA